MKFFSVTTLILLIHVLIYIATDKYIVVYAQETSVEVEIDAVGSAEVTSNGNLHVEESTAGESVVPETVEKEEKEEKEEEKVAVGEAAQPTEKNAETVQPVKLKSSKEVIEEENHEAACPFDFKKKTENVGFGKKLLRNLCPYKWNLKKKLGLLCPWKCPKLQLLCPWKCPPIKAFFSKIGNLVKRLLGIK